MGEPTEDVVWTSVLDDRYNIRVVRIDASSGTLEVHDTVEDVALMSETVSLAYGAQFGPDVSDVALWQEKVIALVDG